MCKDVFWLYFGIKLYFFKMSYIVKLFAGNKVTGTGNKTRIFMLCDTKYLI